MSEDETTDIKCDICNHSRIGLIRLSLLSDKLKFPPKILCTQCLMADQLAMFELAKKDFPAEAKITKEIASLLLKQKKKINDKILMQAHEMATKEEKSDERR